MSPNGDSTPPIGTQVRDAALLRYLCEEHWAIRESVMNRLLEIVARHADGVKLSTEQIAAAVGPAQGDDERDAEPAYREVGDTAFVTIAGVLAKHASMVNGVSQPQGSSTDRIGSDLFKARANARIKNVVLRVESPGGSVGGISDLGDAIYAMNGEKRMIAFADDQACSAALWLAAQCRELYANKAAAVGSIGVICVIEDRSERAKAMGLKYHVVKSGPFKGNAGAPIAPSAEDLQQVQEQVDSLHAVFVQEVARGRGLAVSAVAAFADGRIFTGQQAADLGLIDGICSFDDLLSMISAGADSPSPISTPPRGRTLHAAQGDQNMTVQSEAAAKAAGDQAASDAAAAEKIRAAREAGASAERERISLIHGALQDAIFWAARDEAIAQGLDLTASKALAFDAALAGLAASAQTIAAARKETAEAKAETEKLRKLTLSAGVKEPLPIGKDPEDPANAGADGPYEARVAELVKAGKSESRARVLAAADFPEAHDAWRKAQTKALRKT